MSDEETNVSEGGPLAPPPESDLPKEEKPKGRKAKAAAERVLPRGKVGVYNPDDEKIRQPYGGREFFIEPETVTEIVSPFTDGTTADGIANLIVDKWQQFGVFKVTDKMTEDEFEEAKAESTATYLANTLKWAVEIIAKRKKVEFEIKSHGLPAPAKTVDQERADLWLARNQARLKQARLIA